MDQVEQALKAFREGKLVGLPTETVYGLAAPSRSDTLVKKIFSLKERPFYDPLILHVTGSEMAKEFVSHWPEEAELLSKAFWPGPLTIILKKHSSVSDLITAGLSSVGIRSPNSKMALDLIEKTGDALAAPSANKFTKTSPSCAEHVRETFSDQEVFVMDGGACQVGIESTIVSLLDVSELKRIDILRPGMISLEKIQNVLGRNIEVITGKNAFEENAARLSPGLEKVHYSPLFPCGLVRHSNLSQVSEVKPFEFVELDSDPFVTAREVYTHLRKPLASEFDGRYFVIPSKEKLNFEEAQLWQSILDRLIKASSLPIFL
jgi:L-threonylcarbamoyladenylate synthase